MKYKVLNLKINMKKLNIYIIGIGGAGTSALARLYKSQRYNVSGSDDGDGFYDDSLKKEGIEVFKKFDAKNIPKEVDFVVHSTAFNDSNVEIAEVKNRNLKLLSYPKALGEITADYYTIAVCGTHGKTTTTGFTAHTLMSCQKDPTVIIGAPVTGWNTGGFRKGSEEFLVIEADEYQNKLALYHPKSVILTSLDFDHPDFFKDFDDYKKVFVDFVKRIPSQGFLIAYGDDQDVVKVARNAECKVITYGTKHNVDVHITKRKIIRGKQYIEFSYGGKDYDITINLFGLHNALNAIASWTMSFVLTGYVELSNKGVSNFLGTKRRLEKRGKLGETLLFDDYAHHPEEIRATLSTLREVFPNKRIIAAFHPHTFSRTKALLEGFARMLDIASEVIILDIYGSAREEQGGVSSQDLVDEINQGIQKKAYNLKDIEELAKFIKENLTEDEVFITLGAGDIYKVYDIIEDEIVSE